MHTYTYMCESTHTCKHSCLRTHMHARMHARTHARTHARAHTHTHTHAPTSNFKKPGEPGSIYISWLNPIHAKQIVMT